MFKLLALQPLRFLVISSLDIEWTLSSCLHYVFQGVAGLGEELWCLCSVSYGGRQGRGPWVAEFSRISFGLLRNSCVDLCLPTIFCHLLCSPQT